MPNKNEIDPLQALTDRPDYRHKSPEAAALTKTFIGMGKHCPTENRRIFERRTRRDRRRVWKNPRFKGFERRQRKRRNVFNRRKTYVALDDLGKNIP